MKNKKESLNSFSPKMKKKAELTTQQIVMLIVLLVSFVVLLFFLYKINFKDLSEKQICQSSVSLSGKKSFFSNIDCKTNYLCISGGEACSGFTLKNTIKIDLNAKDAKTQIMKAIADEMVDCWWMFGEGKINYVDWSITGDRSCAVCSEIAFGSAIASSKEVGSISFKDIYEYMKIAKKTEAQTYLEYFEIDYTKIDSAYLFRPLDFKEKYGVYTGRTRAGVIISGLSFSPYGESKEAFSPVLLKRTESDIMKCTSFVTTP